MKTNTTHPIGRLAALLTLAVLVLSLATGTALAEREVNESGSASATGRVYVENLAGSVTIKGWDKNTIEVTGTLDEKAKKLNFETGKKSVIEVVYPRKVRNIEEGSHLLIMVPEGSSLEVECVSATIEISGVEGEIEVENVSGDVDIVGPCTSVDVDVISGTVTVVDPGKLLSIDCVSGGVKARGGEAEVSIEGVSGSIDLEFELFRNLSVESVSGSIDVTGDLAGSGSFSLDVHSGDVTLTVPANVSAEFETSSFSGDIKTDFGYEGHRTSKYAPGQELEFSVGDGDADVEINTFSGTIEIRKK